MKIKSNETFSQRRWHITRSNQALQSLSPDKNRQVVEHDYHHELLKISLPTSGLKILFKATKILLKATFEHKSSIIKDCSGSA